MVGEFKCIQKWEQHSSEVATETDAGGRNMVENFSNRTHEQMGGFWINKSEMVKIRWKIKRGGSENVKRH